MAEGLVKEDETCGHLPTSMVISLEEGQTIYGNIEAAAQELAATLQKNKAIVEAAATKLSLASLSRRQDVLFFLYSNVVLDNWQLNAVEKALVGETRTKRGSKHYYFAFLEKAQKQDREAFGIYGNQMGTFGSSMVGIYGNNRSRRNFLNVSDEDFAGLFKGSSRDEVLAELIRWMKTTSPRSPLPNQAGYESLGLIRDGQPNVILFQRSDVAVVEGLAGQLRETVIDVLKRHEPQLRKAYDESQFSEAVSYAEYFVWVYHFLYTRTTDLLAPDAFEIPESGNVSFVLVP
jgi:hypothetical protein